MSELTGLPATGPTSPELVQMLLPKAADPLLGMVVDGTNNLVRGWKCSEAAVDQAEWPESLVLGATLLAARLYRRKDTTDGVATFGDLGAVYVARNDPDVAQLLGLGAFQGPGIG